MGRWEAGSGHLLGAGLEPASLVLLLGGGRLHVGAAAPHLLQWWQRHLPGAGVGEQARWKTIYSPLQHPLSI